MRLSILPATLLVIALTASAALAHATPEDAKDLAERATALIQAKGLDAARDALHQDGEFKHGELYVNVINRAGNWLVYPPMPTGEGRSVLDIQDVNGKYIVRDIVKVASDSGEGWVEYRWLNPATKQPGPKVSYVKQVPGTDMIV